MAAPIPRIVVFSCCLAAALAVAPRAEAGLTCELIPEFVRAYTQNHVRHHEVTPELERRAIDSYLERLDSSRTLLLASEAEATRASLQGVFGMVNAGDCSRLVEIHRDLLERHQQTESAVRRLLSDPDYQVDPDVELVIDPKERGNPATPEERDALLRSMVHFQMSNYLAAETPLEEAKQKLIHRYELRTRRHADVSREELYAAFLDSFAGALDPHSSYLSSEVLEDFRISMSLSLEGIGVALSERDGYAVAERIIPGGAADRHKGLKPKDKIIAVSQENGEPVTIIDMPLRDAVRLIRGKKGTPVGLTVLRQGEKTERFQITIVRDEIDLAEQAAKLRFGVREVDGRKVKLAVLELPSFYGDADPGKRQATDDVARLLAEVAREKADGLLLDLSRNGGGLLEHAVAISGYFVREGEIVGVRNASGRKQILSDRDEGILYSGPMVVLTSRASASAAEILAGAMKDYGRAVIVGDDHTFGKGTVQTVTALPPGQGALKITTAMFFRPGGLSTQNGGVEADIAIPSLLASDDLGEKTQAHSLPGERIAPFLGASANAIAPEKRWRPLTPALIARLTERSRGRVEASQEFGEIRRKLEEARSRNGVVRLADMIAEQEAARTNGSAVPVDDVAVADSDGDETRTPQIEEALSVLADLVALTG